MKTFVILVVIYTGGTTTLNIEALDLQEAVEIAKDTTSPMDTLVVL
jgi:hypothetical protein